MREKVGRDKFRVGELNEAAFMPNDAEAFTDEFDMLLDAGAMTWQVRYPASI